MLLHEIKQNDRILMQWSIKLQKAAAGTGGESETGRPTRGLLRLDAPISDVDDGGPGAECGQNAFVSFVTQSSKSTVIHLQLR